MFRHFFDHLCIRYLMYDVFCKDGWVVVASLFSAKQIRKRECLTRVFTRGDLVVSFVL